MFSRPSSFNVRTTALYFGIAVVLLAAAVLGMRGKEGRKTSVFLVGQEIIVSIADTKALQERGLSGTHGLKANEGMLFVFSRSGMQGFWMKDMLFPLDIIWFDDSRRIISVKEGAAPSSFPEVFTPPSPAMYVLEVPIGFFEEHHLKIGDMLEIAK